MPEEFRARIDAGNRRDEGVLRNRIVGRGSGCLQMFVASTAAWNALVT
jgi:hypothetical protein